MYCIRKIRFFFSSHFLFSLKVKAAYILWFRSFCKVMWFILCVKVVWASARVVDIFVHLGKVWCGINHWVTFFEVYMLSVILSAGWNCIKLYIDYSSWLLTYCRYISSIWFLVLVYGLLACSQEILYCLSC